MSLSSQNFGFVPEWDNFLDLFPHRGSYLYAEHPSAGDRPQWRCETRHMLSDRLILQGAYLYGVRFGKTTNYVMLDIDSKSCYHPSRDPFAVRRILAALEPVGLSRFVAVSSSGTGGIHLYFPFTWGQTSWKIARAVAALLQSKGFTLEGGQLELFPHPRHYSPSLSEYNGHRLPLQGSSYLLNEEWEQVYTLPEFFIERWRAAQTANAVSPDKVALAIAQFDRTRASGFLKADARKFFSDLNADIEPGWTGPGQTNYLLGRVAMRAYIFQHVLRPDGKQLLGSELVDEIVDVATHLPGFRRWCRHQHEIYQLAWYWARSVESSPKYYPYGGKQQLAKEKPSVEKTWNEKQASDARERIKAAVRLLIEQQQFPSTTKARFMALKQCGVGSGSLYRNKDLWHASENPKPASDEAFPAVPSLEDDSRSLKPASDEEIPPIPLISFKSGSLAPPPEAASEPDLDQSGGSGGVSTGSPALGVEFVLKILKNLKPASRIPPADESPPPDQTWFEGESPAGGVPPHG